MCWGYFDEQRIVAQLRRWLRDDGLLLTSSLLWSSDGDPIARRTAALLARHNPEFAERGIPPESPAMPAWAREGFWLRTYHRYDVGVPFTRESWRGRQRASKWVGAALPPTAVSAFDRELEAELERSAPPSFAIRHTIQIHVYERVASPASSVHAVG